MTKDDYMQRCETVWAKGLARPELFRLLRDWLDAVMRYEHSLFSIGGQTQGRDWLQFLNAELQRTDDGRRTLANDADGYALQELAAILCHPCQRCAATPNAWHTRPGFCDHKQPKPELSRPAAGHTNPVDAEKRARLQRIVSTGVAMKTPIEALLDTVDWRESPPPLEDFGSRFLPDGLPRVTHFGEVDIMGFKLRCSRLTNGQTIFNAEDIHEFFGDNPYPGFDVDLSANG